LTSLPLPIGVEEIGETSWCLVPADQLGIVGHDRKVDAPECEHARSVPLVRWAMRCHIFGQVGASKPSRYQAMKCAAPELCTTSQAKIRLAYAWAIRWKSRSAPGAFDAYRNPGKLCLERLGDLFRPR
jgi:hypothetical protein